jgi:hypothetical protein
MPEPPEHEVTSLLQAWSAGDQQALDKLAPLVYQEHIAPHTAIWPVKNTVIPFKLQHLLTRCTKVWLLREQFKELDNGA